MLPSAAALALGAVTRPNRGGVIVNYHILRGEEIRFQLEVLGRWFEFIHLDDLPRRLLLPARRPFCLLTFDDGKLSHFTEIAPELERRGVPAVFYLTTDAVSNGTRLWFDRRESLVRALGRCPAELDLKALKQLPLAALNDRLAQACARFGLWPEIDSDDLRPMSWVEARDLARRGFTIGAHGQSHAILTNETQPRARAEIEGSLAGVSAELGAPCRTFAFPNGNYTLDLAQHALLCGATTVMTTEPMWLRHWSSFWRLPRIQLFGGFSRARIELKIALAAVKGVLPNPDGTGREYRRARRLIRPASGSWLRVGARQTWRPAGVRSGQCLH
jgi:peptidoglycan/xylan/chitin deacetylase (PgdA/CDA1 family)